MKGREGMSERHILSFFMYKEAASYVEYTLHLFFSL
ncbi:hypothetical protein HMPREF9138_00891 [Prevotella histicola F0411]|uniref:Uncharacterized protein n=1 Tax=Prevotella histicola F0411 TaxID=857291 RepID=G6AFL4_9BACT|nr:hypothetical protein HMPREF9138_00891 [Prevotella histicola F0411]